jgi:excisionase family DNA binding protein
MDHEVLMIKTTEPRPRLLTPTEVAALFRVDPKTVGRWRKAGRLKPAFPYAHRPRYREDQVLALIGTSTPAPEMLTRSQVARLFRVDPKTVTRWANQGRLPSIPTLGGHHRYRADQVHALLEKMQAQRSEGAR